MAWWAEAIGKERSSKVAATLVLLKGICIEAVNWAVRVRQSAVDGHLGSRQGCGACSSAAK